MQTKAMPPILLVEDSDDDAFFFERALEQAGVTCPLHHSTNGAEAIAFLQAAASGGGPVPCAIFLDLKMPVVNGFEVLAWLRTQNFPASMAVIVLSGSEHQDDKARAAALGAADYVVKPIRAGHFHRFLRELCSPESGARV